MTVPAITDAPDSGSQQFAEAFRHTIVLDLWVHPITCMVDEQSDDMPRSNHHRRLQIQLDAGKIIFMRPLLASMATINSKPYRLTEAATSLYVVYIHIYSNPIPCLVFTGQPVARLVQRRRNTNCHHYNPRTPFLGPRCHCHHDGSPSVLLTTYAVCTSTTFHKNTTDIHSLR